MKTELVSTKHLQKYKRTVYTVIVLSSLLILGFSIAGISSGHYLALPGQLVLLFVIVTRVEFVRKLKTVSYDDANLYYEVNGYEEQIPFEAVKDITLQSINGIYKIELRSPAQAGPAIFFKPSIWYPINFSRGDEKVNALRRAIRNRKQQLPPQSSGLPLSGLNIG